MLTGTMQVNSRQHLEVGGCDTVELAREFGTPLYVMDEELIRQNCRSYVQALKDNYPRGRIIYAGKAFLVLAMARLVEEEGLGLDIVSGGELYTALKAGFPPGRLYFHGSNKTTGELLDALQSGTGRIVVDSFMELEELIELSGRCGTHETGIMLRIRPGVEAHTHGYIQTGKEDSKFGFGLHDGSAMRAAKKALRAGNGLALKGFHCHIGSQILQLEPFRLAAEVMVNFMAAVRDETGFVAGELDLGGGLGIRYQPGDNPPSIKAFVESIAAAVKDTARRVDIALPELMLEPGRSITGEAGITLYRVGVIKDIPAIRRYVSVDGGMTDNIRPALYQARYEAILANRAAEAAGEKVTIAGKACESGDILIEEAALPAVQKGDLVAVFSTGAYCYSMASNYNRNPRPAVVFVRGGRPKLVVRRESYEHIIALDE